MQGRAIRVIVFAFLSLTCVLLFLFIRHSQETKQVLNDLQQYLPLTHSSSKGAGPWSKEADSLSKEIRPCYGPRGKLLTESKDDQVHVSKLNIPYPKPFAGSYDELSLNRTWLTADARYGPYGFGEEKGGNLRTAVDWEKVDWGDLQNRCAALNKHRVPDARNITQRPRFFLPSENQGEYERPVRTRAHKTGRTAIILRAWGNYDYKKQDLVSLRAMMVEAALGSGGEYAFFILVNIRDKEKRIFESEELYQEALKNTVPAEFRSIAVLFDENLLQAWYPDVSEHRHEFQAYQAVQLFAQFYNDFDHYWQLEMDVRFTTNTLDYLSAVSSFARAEPQKQARERASYVYMPDIHGSYQDFLTAVNTSMSNRAYLAGYPIPELSPYTTTDPGMVIDDFTWGVGVDADLIVTAPCVKAELSEAWVYRGWSRGFDGREPWIRSLPRLFCPPAISRQSGALLDAVHNAQLKGLAVPSEATLPSFALWHGFKMSFPPQPWFMDPMPHPAMADLFFNGVRPQNAGPNGTGSGHGMYGGPEIFPTTDTLTWWWGTAFPQRIMEAWLRGEDMGSDLPHVLRWEDGKVWAPVMALHPVKTNRNL